MKLDFVINKPSKKHTAPAELISLLKVSGLPIGRIKFVMVFLHSHIGAIVRGGSGIVNARKTANQIAPMPSLRILISP